MPFLPGISHGFGGFRPPITPKEADAIEDALRASGGDCEAVALLFGRAINTVRKLRERRAIPEHRVNRNGDEGC